VPGQCHRADESAATARAIVAQQRLGDELVATACQPRKRAWTYSMQKKAPSALRAHLAKVDEVGTQTQGRRPRANEKRSAAAAGAVAA
jgi:hypothetical protein